MLHVVRKEEQILPRARRFTLSCVIPVLNEGPGITALLDALQETLSRLPCEAEIVVVNDGSTDDSGLRILQHVGSVRLRYLELSRNFGKEMALQAGLDAASGDCVVLLDADFQHPLALIPKMVDRWRAGIDMVYGVKRRSGEEGFLKRAAAKVFYSMLSRERGVRVPRDAGDFRLLDRKVVDALNALPERDRFMKGLYAWVGFKSEAVEFTPHERAQGETKYNFTRLTSLAATGITSFSIAPLRCVSIGGVAISLMSVLMGAWLVTEKFVFGQPIPGFATVAASIFFLAGVQLLALGVVGEYVGRIFNEVKQRPRYIVANDVHRAAADKRIPIALEARRGA
jgi:polyisoprenyl-phosphate glycosyltransferase